MQEAAQAQQQPQLKSLLVEPSWLEVLGHEFDKPYMQQLQGFLEQEWSSQTIYPPQNSIFRAFNAVPFGQVCCWYCAAYAASLTYSPEVACYAYLRTLSIKPSWLTSVRTAPSLHMRIVRRPLERLPWSA